ncbi:MAG: ABC transporter substrate-binding protein, partial [Pseudothermotoga sp.]|nr:ABC transporter substrate-binding protein [Pseudothermotoga sp.]
FGVQPDYTLEGQLIAKFFGENLKKKKIGVIYMANDVGKEGLAAVKMRLEKYGMKPALEIAYNPLETDYSALAVDVLRVSPDAIVIYGFLTDTVRWIKTLRDYGVNADIVTTYANADPSFINLAGKYAEGVYLTGWVPLATPDRPEFLRDYQRAVAIFQESYPNQIMSSYAVAGFIAAEVFVEGLVRAGPDLTREKLVEALETFNHWDGILAKDITWGPGLRRGKSTMYFMKIENGIFTPVTDLIGLD